MLLNQAKMLTDESITCDDFTILHLVVTIPVKKLMLNLCIKLEILCFQELY